MLALLLLVLLSSGGAEVIEGERVELRGGEHLLLVEGLKRAKLVVEGGSYEVRKFNQSCEGFDAVLIALGRGEMAVEGWQALCQGEGAHVQVRVREACDASLRVFRGERELDDLSVKTIVKRECDGSSLHISPLLWNTLLLSTREKWVALRLLGRGGEMAIIYGAMTREAPDLPKVANPTPLEGGGEKESMEVRRREIDYLKLIALLALLGIVAVLELALGRKGN